MKPVEDCKCTISVAAEFIIRDLRDGLQYVFA
jgi:hypothetical protein